MIYFNEEELNELKEAESYFHTCVNASYKRNTPIKLDNKVADIYERATNDKVRRNWSCAKCVYDIYLKVGKMYFASMENNKKVSQQLETQLKTNKLETSVTKIEKNETVHSSKGRKKKR